MNSTTNTMENTTAIKTFNPATCNRLVFTCTQTITYRSVMDFEDFTGMDCCPKDKTDEELRKVWIEMCRASDNGLYEHEESGRRRASDDDNYYTSDIIEEAVMDADAAADCEEDETYECYCQECDAVIVGMTAEEFDEDDKLMLCDKYQAEADM